MQFLDLHGISLVWTNIKNYLNELLSFLLNGPNGYVLMSKNGNAIWSDPLTGISTGTHTSAGLMSASDKIKLDFLSEIAEFLVDGAQYDNIIGSDGVVNNLSAYKVNLAGGMTKTEYLAHKDAFKFMRLTDAAGARTTSFILSYQNRNSGTWCGFQFNKANDYDLGIGYVTIAWTGETQVSISALKSITPSNLEKSVSDVAVQIRNLSQRITALGG